ncbi:DNA-directed RNA polymerase III complex subunit Rpc25, variant 2 [Basidiobolus ranarum]|uniref:DNA-directed RNA polymerase III complex subunit Rpc25, variant 2 n=1 Tax=Basidiobolus ranarum TaxID=34480 RepID=A0ABR2WSD5_9FUNG
MVLVYVYLYTTFSKLVKVLSIIVMVVAILKQVSYPNLYMLVKFRLVVFRPFLGEVITGKIRSCSAEGVSVSLGFFDDILIPSALLQESTEFDQNEQVWVWRFDGNELFMDVDETIRLRVIDEMFVDATPIPDAKNKHNSSNPVEPKLLEPPYSLLCSIQEDGLGLISWWGS